MGALSSIASALIPDLLNKYEVIILTETPSEYNRLCHYTEQLSKESKCEIITFSLDVLKEEQIRNFGKLFREEYSVESFIYLAGINMLVPALEVTNDVWELIMNVNLKGFFFTAVEVAKKMIIDNVHGSILGIASQHGVVANMDRAAYCASKAGMIHLSKQLALEWAKYGIRVNVISPTMIYSEKNEELLDSPRLKKEYLTKIPLKKYAKPKDISKAVLFLESQDSELITGHNLVIDGGWTIY